MEVNVKKEMEIHCVELTRVFPFYGYIMMQMPKVYISNQNGTLAVGKRLDEVLLKLYIYEDYIKELYSKVDKTKRSVVDKHILEVLKHEILHVCFYHCSVQLPDEHRKSIACELEANSYINRANLISENGEKPGVFPEDFNLPSKKGMLFYYDALKDNKQYQDLKNQDSQRIKIFIKSGSNSDNNGDNGDSSNKEGECSICITTDGSNSNDNLNDGKISSKQLDSHDQWKELPNDPSIIETIKDIIRKSDDICHQRGDQYGNIPGCLMDQIRQSLEVKKPVIPWQRILRNFVSSSIESILGFTLRRKSKRFGTRPGSYKEDVLKLLVGIDTSGSVCEEQLKLFFNELHWISKEGYVTVDVAECDTMIQRVYPFKKFDGNVQGRGGTDLEPVLDYAVKNKYDCLIFFTDFCTPTISKIYNIPILWCISGGSHYFDHPEYRPYKRGTFLNLDRAIPKKDSGY